MAERVQVAVYSAALFREGCNLAAHGATGAVLRAKVKVPRRSLSEDELKSLAKAWIVRVAFHRALDRKSQLSKERFYSGTDIDLSMIPSAEARSLKEANRT